MSRRPTPKWIRGWECWRCVDCGEYKRRCDYHKRRARFNGLLIYCKECSNRRSRANWQKDIEHSRTLSRAGSARDLAKNPNRQKIKRKENHAQCLEKEREYYASNAESIRKRMSEYGKRTRADRNEYRRRYQKENRDKYLARKILNGRVYRGSIIKPSACERCGTETEKAALHGHHHDYSRPLDVEWLCAGCHAVERRITPLVNRTSPDPLG